MTQHVELQRLLDLCDEIRVLRRRMQDPALQTETISRLKRRSREKLRRLATAISDYQFKGSLRTQLKSLDPRHFLVLATLLRRYLRMSNPYVEGRALLSAVFDSSFDLLKGLEHLRPDGPLRSAGLIVVEQDEDASIEGDLLERRFRLADDVIDGFLEELGLDTGRGDRRLRGYESHAELLVDLKGVHNLYRTRAKRLFSPESWWRLRGPAGDRAQGAIERRIRRARDRVERRMARTDGIESFPVQKLFHDTALSWPEQLIVLHLLFLELLEGNPYADVVALVQLVSRSETDLIDNRPLFGSEGRLRKLDIIDLDQMLESRELTSECHLQNWVIERVLGSPSGRGPIDADERLNFHLYLKRLGSSNFLKDV